MTGRLDGRVAVITGGASGIGAGTAKRFVDEGARVVVADVQIDAGKRLVAELGGAARFVEADVAEEGDVAAAVDLAVREFGRLDCMFNNAGILGAVGPIAETAAADWDRSIAVLLRSVFLGMKHAARVMVPQRSGVILSTSSTAGIVGGLGPARLHRVQDRDRRADQVRGRRARAARRARQRHSAGQHRHGHDGCRVHGERGRHRCHGRAHQGGIAVRVRGRADRHRQRRALPRERRCPERHRPVPGGRRR